MASKLLIIVIFIFYLIAFGLAIAAKQRRSTSRIVEDDQKEHNYCVYDSDIATGYGWVHFCFSWRVRFCCGRSLTPEGSRAWAVTLFIICWLTLLIAEACFLVGSVANAYHTKYKAL